MSAVSNVPWEQDREYTRYTLLFIYACIVYAIIGFSWGAVMGGVSELRHFVDQRLHGNLIVRAHTHVNLLGWVEMAIFGSVYYLVPRLIKLPIYSLRLVKVHFWIHNIGLVGMVILFTLAGVTGGIASLESTPHEVEQVIRPYLAGVGIFGSLVLLANVIWGFNIFMTCRPWHRK